MKRYRIPFEYWEDDYTKRIRKKIGNKEADDREHYFKTRCVHQRDGWRFPYHLPPGGVLKMKKMGDFSGKYLDCESLVGLHKGKDAHIFCPGPSLSDVNPEDFEGKLTFAVSSAAFVIPSIYWVVAESSYADWLVQREFPWGPCMLLTARAAVCLREAEYNAGKSLLSFAFILRWEEELIIPCRAPSGATVMNALVSAWQMGCKTAYVYGLDLSKKDGPYVDGAPHTREGARRSFDEQIRTLEQFELPGFRVVNCSPGNRIKRFDENRPSKR